MVFCNNKAHLHLGLALLASLGLHAFVLLVQTPSTLATRQQLSHHLSISLTHVWPDVVTHEPSHDTKTKSFSGTENPPDTEETQEQFPQTAQPSPSLFNWQPSVTPHPATAPLTDPAQAAMAAQMKQLQIQALMGSLNEVAADIAPQLVDHYSCETHTNGSVSCDLPSDVVWQHQLVHWLALQAQLQTLNKTYVPTRIQGPQGSLSLSLRLPVETAQTTSDAGQAQIN